VYETRQQEDDADVLRASSPGWFTKGFWMHLPCLQSGPPSPGRIRSSRLPRIRSEDLSRPQSGRTILAEMRRSVWCFWTRECESRNCACSDSQTLIPPDPHTAPSKSKWMDASRGKSIVQCDLPPIMKGMITERRLTRRGREALRSQVEAKVKLVILTLCLCLASVAARGNDGNAPHEEFWPMLAAFVGTAVFLAAMVWKALRGLRPGSSDW